MISSRLVSLALLALAVLILFPCSTFAASSLDRLRQYQRRCFRIVQPCVMFMDEEKAYGCAQCGDDKRARVVREFVQREQLLRFLKSENQQRIIMIPEYLFFITAVLNALSTTKNVAAVVVYEPDSDSTDSTPLPFPPLQVRQLSTDLTEPNLKYNIYTPSPNPSEIPFPIARNPVGKGLKYQLYQFNIFRVNKTTAAFIRENIRRFPGQDENDLAPNGGNKSSPTSPRYKLQSVGQMFACPSSPAATPTATSGAEDDNGVPSPAPFAMNSAKCLKDRTCLPIGGQSLWSAYGLVDPSIPNEDRNVLAITAPMDSIAFFPDSALGASAEITSLAVLLAVAEAVAKYRRSADGKDRPMRAQPIYFAWNAQSWGYAGSSRFLRDVLEFNCTKPRNHEKRESGCEEPFMDSLKFRGFKNANFTVLNIGQLTSPDSGTRTERNASFKFYTQGGRAETLTAYPLQEILTEQFRRFPDSPLTLEEGNNTLLPIDASQSFYRYFPGSEVVTVANYRSNFSNTFYHSIYDNVTLIGDRKPIYRAADAIANSAIKFSFEDSGARVSVNTTIIDQVLLCITDKWEECGLAREYMEKEVYKNIIPERVSPGNYPGSFFPVTRLSKVNPSGAAKIALIRSFLAYHNRYMGGDIPCDATKDCKDFINNLNDDVNPTSQFELRTAYCARGFCVASDTYTHNAFGTALKANNPFQSSFEYVNRTETDIGRPGPLEAGWTESVWDDDLGLCGFVEDTALFGSLVLAAGVTVFLLSVAFMIWFDRLMFKVPAEAEELQRLTAEEPSV